METTVSKRSRLLFGVIVKNGGETSRVLPPFPLQTDQPRQPAGTPQLGSKAISDPSGKSIFGDTSVRQMQ